MSTIYSTGELAHELGAFTADLLTLIALLVLLNAYAFTLRTRGGPWSVASILGLLRERYRLGCLTGFGRAEKSTTAAVGQSVLNVLTNQRGSRPTLSVRR
jgi:hypothetical protein